LKTDSGGEVGFSVWSVLFSFEAAGKWPESSVVFSGVGYFVASSALLASAESAGGSFG